MFCLQESPLSYRNLLFCERNSKVIRLLNIIITIYFTESFYIRIMDHDTVTAHDAVGKVRLSFMLF